MHVERYPPPSNVHIHNIIPGQLTFGWNKSWNSTCNSVHYAMKATNCGTCPTHIPIYSTSITCADVIANGNVCSFTVQTVVCENTTGNESIPLELKLKGRLNIIISTVHFIYTIMCTTHH